MNIERLLGYVNDIERYAKDLSAVSVGYSMSMKQIADGIRELIETEQKTFSELKEKIGNDIGVVSDKDIEFIVNKYHETLEKLAKW